MTNPIKNQAETQKVELPVPIEKDGNDLTHIDISKPHSGDLRGLSLIDVCEMKFDAGVKVIPRVSCLTERDMLNMPPENWAPLLTTIASFFVSTEL